jgi:hypothetical protein
LLFGFLVLLFAVYPFYELVGPLTLRIATAAVLLAALYAVGERRSTLAGGLIVAVPALLTHVGGYFQTRTGFRALEAGAASLFLAYTTILILLHVLREERVTMQTLSAALCVYLLIGLTWAYAYAGLAVIHPQSFHFPAEPAELFGPDRFALPHFPDFFYYSFVTLTTLGYGDILPISPAARSLSALQAVAGQIYLAVLIARLVGLHIVHSMGARHGGPPGSEAPGEGGRRE